MEMEEDKERQIGKKLKIQGGGVARGKDGGEMELKVRVQRELWLMLG